MLRIDRLVEDLLLEPVAVVGVLEELLSVLPRTQNLVAPAVFQAQLGSYVLSTWYSS